ncbi:MAG: hypothetical protein HQM10_08745 [Candidatus Riflebacteria bacterium]|nr:hypothetical protein [Candidatus Riflebacteria bacterium]
MKTGDETWKWALVLILAGVFILLANQTYQSLFNSQEDFPPPEDYLQGDSFDIEQRKKGSVPGSGQPIEVPEPNETAPVTSPVVSPETPSASETPESVNWGEVGDPSR